MTEQRDCDLVQQQLSLLLYGELSFDEEEAIHSHIAAGCEACRVALETERELHEMMEAQAAGMEPAADLLLANRRKLMDSVTALPVPGREPLWTRIRMAATMIAPAPVWRMAAACGLLMLGFVGGRAYAERPPAQTAMMEGQHPMSARVRQVETDGSGMLRLVVDETRQRTVVGSADDAAIRRLLISAAVDPSDAGLRGETVEILRTAAPSEETREALLHAMLRDANDGVRLRALEGLKPYASQPDVRRAMAEVLLRDLNSGVRTQAVDVLTQSRADMNTEIHLVGVFQELMQRESNDYIRMQCQRKLREWKASDEVY